MSEFGGKLDEIEEVSIDRFDRDNLKSTAFFLSHCHSDHMKGLKSKEFQEALRESDDIYLYCSEISCCILKNDSYYGHLEHKIKALTTTQSHILTIPSLNDSRKEICVTLIPAGHCPGSVMFLFELPAGNVLFTGDFRVTMTDVKNLSQLHHGDGTLKEINTCYLDATFFDELYPSFPSREESLKKICDLIKEWLTGDNSNEILLVSPARYGCEHIFVGINEALGMKIHVKDNIFLKYRTILKIGSAITSKYDVTRIHACCQIEQYCCRKPGANWKILRLSCMWFQKEHATKGEIFQLCPNYTRVCYACHSSHSEIVEFLKYLSPRRVVVFATPKGKSAHEVEKEIHDLLKGKKKRNEEKVDEVAKVWKKRRVFDVKELQPHISVSQFQLTEEWSLEDGEARGTVPSDSHHNSSETSIPENGETLGRDSEGSLSFLPQCHTPTDPLVSRQGKDDFEIITLSSDDSSEVIVIE